MNEGENKSNDVSSVDETPTNAGVGEPVEDKNAPLGIEPTLPQVSIYDRGQDLVSGLKEWALESALTARDDTVGCAKEIVEECVPTIKSADVIANVKYGLANFSHIPYFPAFHRPGWLMRYVVGPYDAAWSEGIFADFWAGVTVGFILIPQALSYAALANLAPIVGLYCALIPSAVYTFFGSSLQLAVGPVALVSLLTGEIITHYVPDYATNTERAIDCAGQASLCCGIILTGMSLLNLGYLINFMSHPVMSGFTTGAAMIIGANQLKGAFGFSNTVPQQGQPGYHYNWEVFKWYSINWNGQYNYDYLTNQGIKLTSKQKFSNHRYYRNFIATRICFGLYCPLMMIVFLKNSVKGTEERRKTFWFKTFTIVCNIFPFIGLIIGTHVAWRIKHDDHYTDTRKLYLHNYYASTLKIVGNIAPGLNLLRTPGIHFPLGQFFIDCIPLTLIAFMEGYAVARRIAAQRNELHILNASQEMWAIGIANMLASIGTAYPVSGSFSRSSLNHACGAKTPLSKVTCLGMILLVLGALTSLLQYVPSAALAAIIFQAIYSLVSFSDMWEAWKHSKNDFVVMFATMLCVVVWNTDIALAVGIGLSVFAYQFDSRTSKNTDPVLIKSNAVDGEGIDIVAINSDLNFINASRIKDFVSLLTLKTEDTPDSTSKQELLRDSIAKAFDYVLTPFPPKTVDKLPKAIVLDMSVVRTFDLTGLEAIAEVLHETRVKGVLVAISNVFPPLIDKFKKFGIKNDSSIPGVDLEPYVATAPLDRRAAKVSAPNVKDVEAFGIPAAAGLAFADLNSAPQEPQRRPSWNMGNMLPDMPPSVVNPSTYFTVPESEKN